jgi:hypothetical protein
MKRHIPINRRGAARRERGAAVVLAMMFMMIFGSLAAAMAIVAEGNLRTADTHMRLNSALAAAETGMQYMTHRLDRVTAPDPDDSTSGVQRRYGRITPQRAEEIWTEVRTKLLDSLAGETHNIQPPYFETKSSGHYVLHAGPIAIGPQAPAFEATLQQHPIPNEDYSDSNPYYDRPPFDGSQPETGIKQAITASNPLDARFVRVKVWASVGKGTDKITRSLKMDFRVDKKIPYALLSRSRIMIGKNVMINGPIGSRFTDTQLSNGHPIQMQSDFRDLLPDSRIEALTSLLVPGGPYGGADVNHDNRINVSNEAETAGMSAPQADDINGDGYIDGYDFFLDEFDDNGDNRVSKIELDTSSNTDAAQLFELIDQWGTSKRRGYDDGFIDNKDQYTKVRGQVELKAARDGWEAEDGATNGDPYQQYFEGAIRPDEGEDPMTFESDRSDRYQFNTDDFDVSTYREQTASDLTTQAQDEASNHDPDDPDSPQPLGTEVREAVPYGAAHPYDFYDRTVYENMTFEDVRIPEGTNAVFRDCKFIGVTFVDTERNNTDENYGVAGTEEESGFPRYPGENVEIDGETRESSKPFSNNLRFHNCTFEGAVVTDNPKDYTHVRNKLSFTGDTQFKIEESTNLSEQEKDQYKRSTLLAPHFSVEMGSFLDPAAEGETVQLSGTIVAGLVDMRGQVQVTGTVLTTYTPGSEDGPTLGGNTPQFNTTLGYFTSEEGDLEAEPPDGGRGLIRVTYDPTIPLPDGIMSPVQVAPVRATYFEGG